jgi:hypothetical protein
MCYFQLSVPDSHSLRLIVKISGEHLANRAPIELAAEF